MKLNKSRKNAVSKEHGSKTGTNVPLKDSDVSRETFSEQDADIVQIEQSQSDGVIASPSLEQLYKRFRSSKLSVAESAFNAVYLYCNDRYYSSGAQIKDKYKNIYAHPDMWYKNASDLWRHNKWSVAVVALEIFPALHRLGQRAVKRMKAFGAKLKSLWRNMEYSHVAIRSIGRVTKAIAVYGLVIAFGLFCAATIAKTLGTSPMLGLYVDGNFAGNALSVADVENAQKVFDEAMSLNLGKSYRLENKIEYKPVMGQNGSQLNQSGITDILEKTAGGNMMQGYGLYVDGALIGASPYKAWIDSSIAESLDIRKKHMETTGERVDNLTYYNNMSVNAGTFPRSTFMTLSQVRTMFGLEPITDSDHELISSGAQRHIGGTSVNAHMHGNSQRLIVTLNTALPSEENLMPSLVTDLKSSNDSLMLLNDETLLNVIVEKNETIVEDIPYDIQTIEDPETVEGRKKTLEKGVKGKRQVLYTVGYVGGRELRRTEISFEVIKEPTTEIISIGTRPMTEEEKRVASKGYYIWPCIGSETLSSPYGWRVWGGTSNEFHKGMDISRNHGTGPYPTIIAADGGEVIQAGNDGDGYGLCVLIQHDDGTVTRYAHCSELYVEVGQKVAQGEELGLMGQTGAATGVHLHFEVVVEGVLKNPADYITVPDK